MKQEQNKKRLMIRVCLQMNIRVQESEKVTDSGAIYSEIGAGSRDAKQALHHMSQVLYVMQKPRDITPRRNLSVIIHGIPKPFVKEKKQR